MFGASLVLGFWGLVLSPQRTALARIPTLRQNAAHHFSKNIREAIIPSLQPIREPGMLDPQEL
jgi:hypothetical protein